MVLRLLHGLLAVLGFVVCALLVTSRGGHPPAIILLPVAVPIWGGGHLLLWWVARVRRRTGSFRPPWPILVTLVGSGLVAFVAFWWILVSWVLADGRERWLGSSWLWVIAFLPWLVHTLCFLALVLRHPQSGLLAAGVWLGWAALLVVQVVREVARYGVRSAGELTVALALIAVCGSMTAFVWRARHAV